MDRAVNKGKRFIRLRKRGLKSSPFIIAVRVKITACQIAAADSVDAERRHLFNGILDRRAKIGLIVVFGAETDIADRVGVIVSARALFAVAVKGFYIIHLGSGAGGIHKRAVPRTRVSETLVCVVASCMPIAALTREDIVSLHSGGSQSVFIGFIPGASVIKRRFGYISHPPAPRTVSAALIHCNGKSYAEIGDLIEIGISACVNINIAYGFGDGFRNDIHIVSAIFGIGSISDAPVLSSIASAVIIRSRLSVILNKDISEALGSTRCIGV